MTTRKLTEKNEENESNGSFPDENDAPLTLDQSMFVLSETIKQLHNRVNGVRFKEHRSDKAKLEHIRALVGISKVYSGLLRDSKISDMEIRLSDLETCMRDADDKN